MRGMELSVVSRQFLSAAHIKEMRELRNVLLGLGLLLILVGAIWIGQGLGFIRGSFMTGQDLWLWIGVACAVGGVGMVFVALRGSS